MRMKRARREVETASTCRSTPDTPSVGVVFTTCSTEMRSACSESYQIHKSDNRLQRSHRAMSLWYLCGLELEGHRDEEHRRLVVHHVQL